MDDIFELQEQLSRQIVAGLKVTLSGEDNRALGERPIKSPKAYELYLKARRELDKTTKLAIDRAVSFIQRAEGHRGAQPHAAAGHGDGLSGLSRHGVGNRR